MTVLYELQRVIYRATDPNDDDVIKLLGCYPSLDEADLALDYYSSRYPWWEMIIE